jgi:hypothetical protein
LLVAKPTYMGAKLALAKPMLDRIKTTRDQGYTVRVADGYDGGGQHPKRNG